MPLEPMRVKVNPATLVVGGGIAGLQATLELADAGYHVYLVEREPSIGGHMAQFDKTFPTLDCSACILTPKMSEVGQHENVTMLTYCELEEVTGSWAISRPRSAARPAMWTSRNAPAAVSASSVPGAAPALPIPRDRQRRQWQCTGCPWSPCLARGKRHCR